MQEELLEILAQHPLMSPEQLGVLLASHPNVIRNELRGLQEKSFVARINPRSPDISPRALFYLTAKGVEQLQRKSDSFNSRVAHLWLLIERVYSVRNMLLRLQHPYHVTTWEVEGKMRFTYRNKQRSITLHALAVARVQGDTIPFVIEWDMGILEYEQVRMARMVEWYSVLRSQSVERMRTPLILIVVAQDVHHLIAYYTQLRAISLARNLPTPPTFFATINNLAKQPVTTPLWYSSVSKNKQALFANFGSSSTSSTQTQSQTLHMQPLFVTSKVQHLAIAEFDPSKSAAVNSQLALKRDLSPQMKRTLNEIAAHPLLSASEVATLLDDLSGQVHRALKQLAQIGLLKSFSVKDETRYLLGSDGIHFLAATNGFGRAVKAYQRARGWKHGLSALIRHWEHTYAENQLFLELARVARLRHADFEWRSETESRLYYAAQGRRWSFLPDGLCEYADENVRLRLAVEIERHRASKKRLAIKLTWYSMYVEATLYRVAREEEFRLLIITTSWRRAQTIRRAAQEVARQRVTTMLPLWITTFDLLREQGTQRPIWRKADTWERATCF